MATDLYQAWSHRWGGVATLEITDSSGTYSISTSSTVAADRDFCHLSLAAVTPDARDASPIDLGYASFAAWLKVALDAASARTYTVAFSPTTLAYTISVDSGTVALTFPATAAGRRMRRILGFTASKTAAASHTSDMRPWYVIRAHVDGRSEWRPPTVAQGQIRVGRTSSGQPYAVAATRLYKTSRWEHRHEPRAAVRIADAVSDTTPGGASWTWEDALDHASRYGVPCVVRDSSGAMVFYTSTPLEEGATAIQGRYLDHQIVRISADAIVGYL